MPPTLKDRIVGGIVGSVVGDALGVPVEFFARDFLRETPVAGMRGMGTHFQPLGTWSDDSSLALTTAESLLGGYNPTDMMNRFLRWLKHAEWSARGKVFDVGNTTRTAIYAWEDYHDLSRCGGRDEMDNGNGSLMRILPLSLYAHRLEPEVIAERSSEVSALTHAHAVSRRCCAYHSFLVQGLLDGAGFGMAMSRAADSLAGCFAERIEPLDDVLSGAVCNRSEDDVLAGGYVVQTLEASLWTVHRCSGFAESVLNAVNLGGDADTTGAVTGGLAGVIYGLDAIPFEWVDAIARKDDILDLAGKFADAIES